MRRHAIRTIIVMLSIVAAASTVAGCPAALLRVPDVVGLSLENAAAAIQSAGFTVGEVTEEESSTAPEGVVTRQDPAAGANAEAGSAVDLMVSTAIANDGPEGEDEGEAGPSEGEGEDATEGEGTAGQRSALGMNLAAPNHSSDVAFVDLMHTTNGFLLEEDNSLIQENLDANGWPMTLAAGPAVVRLMGWAGELAPFMPAGDYILLYEGAGTIEIDGAAEVEGSRQAADGTTRVLYRFEPGDFGITLRLLETDPDDTGDYVRNIRFLLPGHETGYDAQIFNPAFLEAWRKYTCFRHVQSMQVWPFQSDLEDPSEPVLLDVEWSGRARPEDFRWGQRWSYDIAIELSNRLDAELWLTIPHTASRDYVEQLAQFVAGALKPGLTVYVEYTNEAWNFMSATYEWLRAEAAADGLGVVEGMATTDDEYLMALRKYTQLAVEYGVIFRETFEAAGRGSDVLLVYGGSENTYIYAEDEDGVENGNELGALYFPVGGRPAYTYFDVWATTSYVGGVLGFEQQRLVMNWSVDSLYAYLLTGEQPTDDPTAIPRLAGTSIKEGTLAATLHELERMNAFAEAYGMHHVVYEGGPHFVALEYGADGEGNEFVLTPDEWARIDGLFNQAIADPRLGGIMTALLDGAREAGVTMHVMFNSCEMPGLSQWSKFGFLDHIYQDFAASAKYQATNAWMDANPRWWTSLQRGS